MPCRRQGRLLAGLVALALVLAAGPARGTVSSRTMDQVTSYPMNIVESATPLVMIGASKDHQLFYRAYNDFTDLDEDGVTETTYDHSIDYYGYFDSHKCYSYDAGDQRFEPAAITTDKYCTGANDSYWSGNFLNWATMARIDTIRKILFGGHRRVDTATETVLERVYLPHDAHSWAKHYEGADLQSLTPFVRGTDYPCDLGNPGGCTSASDRGITLCNTTDVSGSPYSQDVTAPPLVKVVKGNYALWAANERWQCTWASGASQDNHSASNGNDPAVSGLNAKSSSPAYSQGIGQKSYVARVQVCVSGLVGEERCKGYPGGSTKPVGLLQVYGDEDHLFFGMMAGTYKKHASGGEVVRNIGSMADEIDVEGSGTFTHVAATAGGPIGHPYNDAFGLINAWSLFRLKGYYHGDGTYNNTGSGDNCSWGLSNPATVTQTGKCENWGNPFSEIFLQSVRYLSGAGVSGTFRSNLSTGIPGLPTPLPWQDPLSEANACAGMSIVNFNSSVASYDADELDGTSDGVKDIWDNDVLPGAKTASAMTDVVGAGEGVHGGSYFVGEVDVDSQGDADDQLCTGKTVSSLGEAGGLCPESPRLQGSFRVAGLAYYAHTEDIRSEALEGQRPLDGEQTVDTYAVTFASVPKMVIPHPVTGQAAVTLLPACRNTSLNPDGNCAVVDFKIASQVINNGAGVGSGKLYINWEDSEQGGDYDQDMWGTIDYVIDSTANTIAITTEVHAVSTPYVMGFGYIIDGTTQDGFHVHSGINGYVYNDPANITAGADCAGGCNCRTSGYGACNPGDVASTALYSLGSSSAGLLRDPLWYAAKWGGFRDSNGNDLPDLDSEWDRVNQNGQPVPDGIPDYYFYATNPTRLEESLNRVLLNIIQRASSGTAAAVVANNIRGEGALYQAYYEPSRQDAAGNRATWIGTLHALWLDRRGLLREDNGDAKLGSYLEDPVVDLFFDEEVSQTRVRRWSSSQESRFAPEGSVVVELSDLQSLWNAREQLYFNPAVNLATQRSYSLPASGGRFIKTWMDSDGDGAVDTGELQDFTAAQITGGNFGFLDVASEAEAEALVDYIRGKETAGLRNRTVDYDGDGQTEVMRLGDIVNSTPTLVSSPRESFDLIYRDSSYTTFRFQYANRRHVVYVGGNDGMLHAFNGGFYDAGQQRFTTAGLRPDGSAATAHPLGAELWAYVPQSLLPQLKWLKDPDYSHVYYMDHKPRVFDAKIFAQDQDHPNGWGTVLVAGMRMGGTVATVDTSGNGLTGGPDDRTLSSSYVIFDITNPEAEPRLLAEIQLPDASYTVVYPAALAVKDKQAAQDPNAWFLALGSGPTSLSLGTSSGTAKLYVLDLAELANPGGSTQAPAGCTVAASGAIDLISCDTGAGNSFAGNPMVVDWGLSYKADAIYFGLVGDADADTGGLMRLAVDEAPNPANWTAPVRFVDLDRPVSALATPGVDDLGNRWLFFGTGRLLANADKLSTTQQYLLGVKEQYRADEPGTHGAASQVALGDLLDVTGIEVNTAGGVAGGPAGVDSFAELTEAMDSRYLGWSYALPAVIAGGAPATRILTQPALLGSVLFTSVYQPSADTCTPEGFGQLYGLYYKTGTAYPSPNIFGTVPAGDGQVAIKTLPPVHGDPTSPALHVGTEDGLAVFTQVSTGTILREEADTITSIKTGRTSWREID
ncbi:MAG: hypothetical protein AB1634_15010 [Thermodesulfobacteriota bacterium]